LKKKWFFLKKKKRKIKKLIFKVPIVIK